MRQTLIATDQDSVFESIRDGLGEGFALYRVTSVPECLAQLERHRFDYLFLDLPLLAPRPSTPRPSSFRAPLEPLWSLQPSIWMVILAPADRIREAVAAVRAGANEYLCCPFDDSEVQHVVDSIAENNQMQAELAYLRGQMWQAEDKDVVRTRCPQMQAVLKEIRSVAPTRTTVLLTGETGSGKGVMARLIHKHSDRREGPFISVHCGAIPDNLVESELFGHEKGSFTGAFRRERGKFEVAQGGTIFLDEVGTLTASAQIKLLRVLQERTYQRVGSAQDLHADVRIIAATNEDLKQLVEQKLFRNDLYYRLNVFTIEVPPLRTRRADIPILVDVLLDRVRTLHHKDIRGVHPRVMEALESYGWPGNIRELENVIERACILESTPVLTPESLPKDMVEGADREARVDLAEGASLATFRKAGIESLERQYLKELLTRHKGRIASSAREAGISTRQLHKLLTRYGIRKEEFKGPRQSAPADRL